LDFFLQNTDGMFARATSEGRASAWEDRILMKFNNEPLGTDVVRLICHGRIAILSTPRARCALCASHAMR